MKLGVFTPLFNQLSFEEMIDAVAKKGLQTVEIGTGGYPGNAHLDIESLLASSAARKEYLAKLADKGLEISALSCHNNPISPIASVAQEADELLRKTIKLASLMNVPVVNGFSGIAGGNATDRALLRAIASFDTGRAEPACQRIPFDSSRKYAAKIRQSQVQKHW